VLYPSLSCGVCEHCRRGETSLCPHHQLFGEHRRGGFAEQLVVPAANLKRVPDGFPLQEAAAASLVFLTAWRMLVTRGSLRAGESVLVVGAGGGVNTAALQIARLAGASPLLVTATTREKGELARRLGADAVLDARSDWHKEAFARTGRRGVDVVVDNVGAATWGKSLRAAARGGRVVTVGGTTGYEANAELNQVFWKQLTIVGSTMGDRPEFDTVMDLVFEGKLHAVIDSIVPLAEGVEAHRRLAEGKVEGKIVLRA
jgi:NADPH:quinone reductase-like Zn-dependent oxidoreductase